MTAIILAGGKSLRMRGLDKAFLEIKGQPFIKRQIRLLRRHFKKIIIVTNSPQKYKRFRGVRVITDVFAHYGPLGAIFSGLKESKDDYNFVLACDMPFINEALIGYMARLKKDYDVFVPKVGGKLHPLFGIYSKKCLAPAEALLRKKRLRVSGLFKRVKSGFISGNRIAQFDKGLLSLVNINTKGDLSKIK